MVFFRQVARVYQLSQQTIIVCLRKRKAVREHDFNVPKLQESLFKLYYVKRGSYISSSLKFRNANKNNNNSRHQLDLEFVPSFDPLLHEFFFSSVFEI